MRFLHIADLHLGKKISGYSLLEDQVYFLNETLKFLKEHQISALVVAGDIYDVSMPSAEAITAFDNFLTSLADLHIETLIIPGNHDSKERLHYATRFLKRNHIHLQTELEDFFTPVLIEGTAFYLLPFINHHEVNAMFNTSYNDYASAVQGLLEKLPLDENKQNVLVAHQLVLPTHDELERSGSENITIGTLGNIPASIFSSFDYVALGHIHKPQSVAKNARYSGSPLKYHSDEAKTQKSFTVVSLENKNLQIETFSIVPLHDVFVIEGTFKELIARKEHENDFVYILLKEDSLIENAMERLKVVYPLALDLRYENTIGKGADFSNVQNIENISIIDLFTTFYEEQNGTPLNEKQKEIVEGLLKEE